jgi:hypothetical protein
LKTIRLAIQLRRATGNPQRLAGVGREFRMRLALHGAGAAAIELGVAMRGP